MGANRNTVPLGSILASLIDHRGRTPKKLGGGFSLAGVPTLSAKNIKDGQIIFNEDIRYVSPEMYEQWMPEKLRPGDVLLTSEAPLGEVYFVRQETRFCLGQRLFALRADEKNLDGQFLYYLLRSKPVQQRLYARATGTTAQGIRQSELVKIEIEIPRLEEQRAIAHILGTLDDKIELNRQMNETLEATARALFKSWFVDFDPVRAKAEGHQPSGMDAETAALFPDSFGDSPLGKIPKAWKVGRLGEVAENPRHGVNPDEVPEDTPYIGLEHMPRKSIALANWGRSGEVASNKFAFRQGEILFGKLRPYFHKVGVAPQGGVCSTDILVVRAKSTEWYGLVLGHVSSGEFVNYADALSTGTKMPRTNWQDMARYEICLPDSRLADVFSCFVQTVVDMIRQNILQSVTLAPIRDALLPKLIYGEIRVKDAERIIETKTEVV